MAENMAVNFSVFYQIILFVVFALIVNFWIFKPTLHLLERRRILIEGKLKKAELLDHEAATLRHEYETLYQGEQKKAMQKLAAIKETGQHLYREKMEGVKNRIRRELMERRKNLKHSILSAQEKINLEKLTEASLRKIL